MGNGDRWLRTLLIAALALGVVGCNDASRAAAPPPPAVVKVESVVERDVPISVEYVGALVEYINARAGKNSKIAAARRKRIAKTSALQRRLPRSGSPSPRDSSASRSAGPSRRRAPGCGAPAVPPR